MLEVDLTKTLGVLSIQARFATAGGVTALFGPSGSGKTSIVNMIAGLLTPDAGRIALDGALLFDSASGVSVAAHRRRVGYVFQDGRLFPHLSVRANLVFGRWMSGIARDPAEEAHVIDLLGIDRLLARRPGSLSGGEKSRVAIGRALLMKPRLLLLDEPMASLDEARKVEIMPYLERLRDEARVPMVYVSHAADEVRRLASQVVRLDHGQVVATGGIDVLLPAAMPAADARPPSAQGRAVT